MPTLYLVDANSIGYAGQHASDLKTGDMPTSAIYNTLHNLRQLKAKNRTAQFLYLWDSKAQFRYDLLPTYKDKRDDTAEKRQAKAEYHQQQPYIQQMLEHLGIPQLRHDGLEADDLGFYLARHYASKGYHVILVSSDKDWLQMVDENVEWYDPRFDRWCRHNTFEEFTRFDSTEKFVEAKCILGDKSDRIDGIAGLGEKACECIFTRWPNVKAMVAEHKALGEFTKENIGKQFGRYLKKMNLLCSDKQQMAIYVRNRKLMDLSLAPKPVGLQTIKPKRDEAAFFDLCGELAFHSVLGKRELWQNVFFVDHKEVA